jgi:hypothetical protein
MFLIGPPRAAVGHVGVGSKPNRRALVEGVDAQRVREGIQT